MGKRLKFLLITFSLCSWTGPVLADYTLVLKNGRRITVQTYREEGRMIKFHGLGGDIGISKDQIQSIQKADPGEPALQQTQSQESVASPQSAERSLTPEEEKAKEEKEYQQKLIEVTGQLKEVRIVILSCFVERQARSQANWLPRNRSRRAARTLSRVLGMRPPTPANPRLLDY